MSDPKVCRVCGQPKPLLNSDGSCIPCGEWEERERLKTEIREAREAAREVLGLFEPTDEELDYLWAKYPFLRPEDEPVLPLGVG